MRHPEPGELQTFDPQRLEERLRRVDRRRIKVAFIGAIVLHASSALGFAVWTPPDDPVTAPGEMVITIDLAPAVMSTATTENAGEAAESAPQETTPPPEPVETPPEEKVVEEEPQPIPEPAKEEIAEVPEAKKAEVVIAPKKKETAKKKPKPAAPSQTASAAKEKRSDVGGTGASASPSDLAKYIGRLRSALERAKRYPAAAAGANGTASLRFTVNRAGQVTGFALVRSSGNAALDAATRSMLQSASLPPIPEGLPNSITVGVPVNFNTR